MQSCPPHFKTSSQLIKTLTSIQQVELDLLKIRQDNDARYLLQFTPFRVCIDKLSRAAGAAMAENIIFKQKVEELTNSARNKRQALNRSVLSKGQLITMDDVVRICQAEVQRKDNVADHKNKQEAKKKKSEEQLEIPNSQEHGPQVSTAVRKPWEEWSSIIQF